MSVPSVRVLAGHADWRMRVWRKKEAARFKHTPAPVRYYPRLGHVACERNRILRDRAHVAAKRREHDALFLERLFAQLEPPAPPRCGGCGSEDLYRDPARMVYHCACGVCTSHEAAARTTRWR